MRRHTLSSLIVSLAVAAAPAAAAPSHDAAVKKLLAGAPFKKAAAALDADHDRWVQDIVTITEIPAPPFKETVRGKAYLEMLRAEGLTDLETDAEGNVMGLRRGSGPAGGKVVVVSAHLDTVFPEGTPVKVRREGERLYAPGVGDDGTGLATLLSLVRAMNAGGIKTKHDILFVGTVGEEGAGDLRGVRHFFSNGKYKDRVRAFFSLDHGGTEDLIAIAVGSKRYRMTFKGPGGHSYGAFGIVNPMAAMAQAVVDLYKTPVPAEPKVTYSASVTGGGSSVNAIPGEAWMEFDMRSEDPAELAKIEGRLLDVTKAAVDGENAARSTRAGKVSVEVKPIGDRPAGKTDPNGELVQLALAAAKAKGVSLRLTASSTDANIPMSLGVPAATISRSAEGGRAHALDEWTSVEKAPNLLVKEIALATVLAVANAR